MVTFLQAALNGDRRHDAAPRTPSAIAEDAVAAAGAGAHSIHVHAYDEAGYESLHAKDCDAVVAAIRARCPRIPISLTTSAGIVGDPSLRLAMIQEWTVLPDLVSANQGEEGILELAEYLLKRGVEIEAGLLCPDDARRFVTSPLLHRCRRVLIEPFDPDPELALRNAEAMESILADAGVVLPQVHHGLDTSCWAVNRRAIARGHGVRTGLEDVVILPDGQPARDNASLVVAALSL